MVLGLQEKVFGFQITVNHLMTVYVCACICVCVCACMHARMCVYYMYMYMLYRYMYMYGDAALSKKRQEFKTENNFSDLIGQTADHSVEVMSFQNWYECFTTS